MTVLSASGFAFSVPRDGTITSISAVFSNLLTTNILTGSATITAQLYRATTANNTFVPIPGAVVTLPSISGLLAVGGVVSEISTPLAIDVFEEDRLLMVFSVTSTGFGAAVTATGFVNAGVSIT
ncbi:exosporium glycoprotein BclB-related protein [Paenibacillus sp. LHD-38]|uniref:exosporium glycoprotein BclB-related protein n=1 Tax=Paenibacillus sp. LHD-38 TaxID=3072143 RepID=UPI00280E01AB|nr:exosporium glycoprotein BclB-related protein [Paenibacillus sp. LHD-38]MDQ8734903.1 exosporium glycoprotein BclB-related protein [Paenibacillus sp. LHD-38]